MSDTPRPPWPDFRLKEPSKAELAESLELALSAVRSATIEECAAICIKIGDTVTLDKSSIAYDCADDIHALLTTGREK